MIFLTANLPRLPSELHFEVSAAFDHLMRAELLVPQTPSHQENLEKAVGHLKRATFDGFKLLFKYPIRQRWLQLTRPRYNELDNGLFIPKVDALWKDVRQVVCDAQKLERLSKRDDPAAWNAAFVEWRKLLPILHQLDQLAESEIVLRAKRKQLRSIFGAIGVFLLGFIATKGLEWIYSLLRQLFAG